MPVAIPNRSFLGVFCELSPLRETVLHDLGMVEDEKRQLNPHASFQPCYNELQQTN